MNIHWKLYTRGDITSAGHIDFVSENKVTSVVFKKKNSECQYDSVMMAALKGII